MGRTPEEILEIQKKLASDTTIRKEDIKTKKAWGNQKPLQYVDLPLLESIANEIFGHGTWGYEVISGPNPVIVNPNGTTVSGWGAKVRLTVCGFPPRDGVGWCDQVYSNKSGGAVSIEMGYKGAYTDACKKAWATYGNRFGRFLWEGDSEILSQIVNAAEESQPAPTPKQQKPPTAQPVNNPVEGVAELTGLSEIAIALDSARLKKDRPRFAAISKRMGELGFAYKKEEGGEPPAITDKNTQEVLIYLNPPS